MVVGALRVLLRVGRAIGAAAAGATSTFTVAHLDRDDRFRKGR